MILKISLRAKGGVPKTLLEQKHRLNFLYFPQNTLMLTESREEFSDLHSIFRLRALRYCTNTGTKVFVLLRANCRTNCYYNFNPCGIFENMTSFSPIFNQEWNKEN